MNRCHIYKHIKNLIRTIYFLYNQIRTANFRNYVSSNCYKENESLIILANGPSLNKELLAKSVEYINHDVCVVNDFCKSTLYEEIKPKLYLLADPLYFNIDNFRSLEKETINNINNKTTWEIHLLVPYKYQKVAKSIFTNSHIKLIPFHTNQYRGWDVIKFFLYKKGLSSPRIQNVLIACIFNAINLQYKNIYLLGVDHSWTKDICVDQFNRVCLTDSHFYDLKKSQLSPWLKCSGEQYLMHEILRDLAYMFEGYHELAEYAKTKNCNIYNMTENSFIDAFERIKNLKEN